MYTYLLSGRQYHTGSSLSSAWPSYKTQTAYDRRENKGHSAHVMI